jgi:hypothetical protein
MRTEPQHLNTPRRTSRVSLAAVALAFAASLATAAVSTANAANAHKSSGTTVHVIEHAVTDTTVQSGGTGDKTGNLLTFHNNVYDSRDAKRVGTDQGFCVRISPADGSWECIWTTVLARGQITVEGPFYDTHNSVLAITGGTRAYRKARGEMNLYSRNGGKEYDFIFHLTP